MKTCSNSKQTTQIDLGDYQYAEVDVGIVRDVLKELWRGGIDVEGKGVATNTGGKPVH